MKSLNPLAIAVFVFLSTQVSAGPLVIYGEDDRIEVSQGDAFWKNKARSVAVQVKASDLGLSKILGSRQLPSRTLRQKNTLKDSSSGVEMGLCEGTRFADQANPGDCSGFLVAPDILLTAGHCVHTESDCQDKKWVFDFVADIEGKVNLDISEDRIYSCKRIIRSMAANEYGLDFSMIQLDRVAHGRESLEVNIADKIGKKDRLAMIGAPLGLPLKIATDGAVRDDDSVTQFYTTLDSFLGNSGSPVFNQRTGKVEGILVSGEEDFKINNQQMCIEVNVCQEDDCLGEGVSRISSIPEIALRETMQTIAREGKLEELKQIKKMNIDFFVDTYGADGVSPLMTAIENKQIETAAELLKMGASANHQSLSGVRPVELLIASYHNKAQFEEMINILIRSGADIGYKSRNSESLLFAAVKANNQAALEVLLSKGLEAKAKNAQGKTAKDIAKQLKHKTLRKILFRAMHGKGLRGLVSSIFNKKN
ncbi:MAG: trypsin-like peptidase domain-containing protein [Bacteriovoracaceae bacterium]